MYLAVVAELDPAFSVEPELVARVRERVAAGDEGAGELIPDDVLDRFAFSGVPAQVVAQAEAVFEAGAGRVDFGTPHGIAEERGIHLLCTQVLPGLR